MAMAVLFTSIFGALSIVWDREFGFLKEVLVAPINRSAVALGKTLGGASQAMIQGLILLVLAPFVGVKLSALTVLELLPILFLLAFALSALGVALASRVRSMQGFQVVMNFLMLPIFFLSGALFPLSRLPGWMTVLTRLDPAAYGVDPLRRVVLSDSGAGGMLNRFGITYLGHTLPLLLELAFLFLFGALMLAIAVLTFRVQE
jgi:ABC-2 type transport system permease protein